MAISKNYCLYDHTTNVFLKAISFVNDAEAIRWFTTIVNAEDNTQAPSLYPEQFTLMRLMDFDDKTGKYLSREGEDGEQANLARPVITGVEVADKVNMKFTMKQLLTALKSDLLNHDAKVDNNVIKNANEAIN